MSDRLSRVTPTSVRQITVIEVTATRGAGEVPDPVREVTQYWSLDGKLLAERDPETDLTIAERLIT